MLHQSPYGHAMLVRALTALHVWEGMWIDLSYPEGDPRSVIPDSEQDPAWIAEREYLQRQVTRLAALCGGETREAADMFADEPLRLDNPYSVSRARLAVTLWWPISKWMLEWAREKLEQGAFEIAIDSWQSAIERQL